MPFTIIRQDITEMEVDAVVNAANTELRMGGGVCGAIFKAAGADRLREACARLAPIEPGDAVITPGFDLPARFVIHAAAPVYSGKNPERSIRLLRSAYTNALRRAVESGCETVAFPLISSGLYGFPKDVALRVATSAILEFLSDHDLDVTLAVFDKSAFAAASDLAGAVKSYVDERYVGASARSRELLDVERSALCPPKELLAAPSAPLDDLVKDLDEPFSLTLLRMIDDRRMTDVEVYKRANIDRKLFSKIRSGRGYTPGKRTVIALAVALRLTRDETARLLERAGYALSRAVKFDVIVEYFIENGRYDIFEINEVLFQYDQPLLGGSAQGGAA